MKLNLYIFIFLLGAVSITFGQDILYNADNEKLQVKILEINKTKGIVKYNLSADTYSLTYIILIKDVKKIIYKNGSLGDLTDELKINENDLLNENPHKHIISIAPLGFVNHARLKFEYLIDKKASVGAFITYYPISKNSFDDFSGFEISPFGRYFFKETERCSGPYIQGRVLAGYFNGNVKYQGTTYHTPTQTQGFLTGYSSAYSTEFVEEDFTALGCGADLGWQFILGANKRINIDIACGGKYYTYPIGAPGQKTINGEIYNLVPDNRWKEFGQKGFPFSAYFVIGFCF